MRNKIPLEAWLFINHLALQMLYRVLQKLFDKDLSKQYPFDDIIAFLKHIRLNRIGGQWLVSKTAKKTQALCDKLGIRERVWGSMK